MSRACGLARTLKPMITAFDALARMMSLSLMPPTAACSTRTATSSVAELLERGDDRLERALHVGLDDDRRAPWRRRRATCANICSSVPRAPAAACCSRRRRWRILGDVARLAFVCRRRRNRRRPSGAPLRPSTSTGIAGPASVMFLPRSSISARTRPHSLPATKMSPTLSVPRLISTVATAPRPRSSLRLDHAAFGRAVRDWP